MYSFEACYQGSTVYLNKKHQYSTNEILVQLLNHPFENLKELRSELNRTYTTLTLEGEMGFVEAVEQLTDGGIPVLRRV